MFGSSGYKLGLTKLISLTKLQLPALRLPLPMCPPGQDPVQE